MQRQREVAVDDEEELLRMQEHFAARAAQGDARPAAKVTRITRLPTAVARGSGGSIAAPPVAPLPTLAQPLHSCAVHGSGCQGRDEHQQGAATGPQQVAGLMAAMQAAMKDIVGEVQERPAAPAAPPQPPTAATAAAATPSFPQATHRKLSKFALGRQRQQGAVAAPGHGPVAAGILPVRLPASTAGGVAQLDEQAQIDAENRQLLTAMTPKQVAEAREEALQRLPPTAVEFLRLRGAGRAAATPAAPKSSGSVPSTSAEPPASNQQVAATQAPPLARAEASSGMHVQRPRQQQRQQQAATLGQPSTANVSAASRLRFDVEGAVVGLRPAGAGADVAPTDVMQRDPIRQDEGTIAGEGYSVQEACLLAHSRLPQQRVLALRLLGTVLVLSRPSPVASASLCLPLPPTVASELQLAAGLEWGVVWHHALHAAHVSLLLRRSLDDAHPAVVAAAAEALAALLGAAGPAGTAEESAAEAADAAPLTGWPAPPLRHMQHPTASSAWVAAPVCPEWHQCCEADDEGEGKEALDEQQLSKVDPLSGLLHMRLLERVAYLLGVGRAAAALGPLLSILIRCCQAGKDAADQVLATPGMLEAIKGVLDAPPPPSSAPAQARVAVGAGTDSGGAAAFYSARPMALRLLRQLAAASKAAAWQLQEAGLVRFALEHLLRPAVTLGAEVPGSSSSRGGGGNSGSSMTRRGQVTEALRLWRCFAQHGFYLLLLDDAYSTLCTSFVPPAAVAAAAVEGPDLEELQGEGLQQWYVAREAYSTAAQLCWHAARSGPHDSQLSPQCAAALAAGALTWLGALPLQQLVGAYVRRCSSQAAAPPGAGAAGVGARVGLSPYPALVAAAGGGSGRRQAAAVLGTLAAALHFVGSYWSIQVWHTAGEKASAAAQLAKLGMLPAVGGGAAGDGSELPGVLRAVCDMLEQLLASDATWPAEQGSTSTAGSSMSAVAAELAVALARLAATFLSSYQATATCAALLAPLYSQSAAGRFLHAAATTDTTLSQPWDVARQLFVLPLARAAAVGLRFADRANSSSGGGGQTWPVAAADTALALLQLLPAGDEAGALQLMALLLGPRQLAGCTAAAASGLQALAASHVAHLAAGSPSAKGTLPGGPSTLPDARQLSPLLLAGYAAAWLALVPEPRQGGKEQGQVAGAEAAAVLEPPALAAVLQSQGSRLPLPADWMLEELPVPPAEAGIAAAPPFAAGCALLLVVGWEELQLSSLSPTPGPARTEGKLRHAVLLLFGDPEWQAADRGVAPGVTAVAQQDEEAAWQQPLARWCLAALMQRYCSAAAPASSPTSAPASGSAGTGTDARSWHQQEARQLAQLFAAVSYGDRLFGATVALLLRGTVPLDVQLEVLSVLADEQALHLLPPLNLLPGPAAAYLNVPPCEGQAGSGAHTYVRACFGANAVPRVPPASSGSRQELDLYVKLLSEGPLERCLAAATTGGGDANGRLRDGSCHAGCSAAVPLVLHRLACACFPDAPSPGTVRTAAQQAQQHALLCGILQRCGGSVSGSGASGQALLLPLLGMLLCWDAATAQPSDAISQERLQAIKAACTAAGIDAGAMLRLALKA